LTGRGTAATIEGVSRLAALLLALLAAGPALAESSLAAQVQASVARYHEDLARTDTLRARLGEQVKADPDVDDLIALAQVCFIWGDLLAKSADEKLDAYDQGRQAAQRAVDLAPKSVLAHFWYATNTARWGQAKGVTRSLFLLPTVKREIDTVLSLDPAFAPVYSLAGYVYYEVPALLGGDLDQAEQMFRKGLALESNFTGMRVGLAKTLIKKGRIPEARRELQAVLDEKSPRSLADWTMKDARQARELLDALPKS
jgi:tetratricopeptide (TPR) repeat protein